MNKNDKIYSGCFVIIYLFYIYFYIEYFLMFNMEKDFKNAM